ERFELPTLCFEGRCSIQLSYGRTVNYCNPIIELAVGDSDSLKSQFLRCARRCWSESMHHTWICPAESGTRAARQMLDPFELRGRTYRNLIYYRKRLSSGRASPDWGRSDSNLRMM